MRSPTSARSGIMHAVNPARREFFVETAFVVIGAANAIRGILVGNTAMAVSGFVLLGLIVATLAFGPVVARLFLRVFRRPPGKRWARVFAVVFAISVLTDVTRGISAIANHDWGSLLFYAARLPADAVLMTHFATWSRRIDYGTNRPNATASLSGHRAP
jgi:hypothetical protein